MAVFYFYLMKTFSFTTVEKLKSKKEITHLFAVGKSRTCFPIKLIYTPYDFDERTPLKVGVSVSKRNFKRAVDRNRIKRLLREGYRLNKPIIFNDLGRKYICMFLYIGKEKPTFQEIHDTMERLLQDFKVLIAAKTT